MRVLILIAGRDPGRDLALLEGRPVVGWTLRSLRRLLNATPHVSGRVVLCSTSDAVAAACPEVAWRLHADSPPQRLAELAAERERGEGHDPDLVLLCEADAPPSRPSWEAALRLGPSSGPGLIELARGEPSSASDLARARAALEAHAQGRRVRLGARELGDGLPCLIIAEVGVNHDGDPAVALELIRAAAQAGADGVKLQTFCPGELVTSGAPRAEYQLRAGGGTDQLRMLERLVLPPESLPALKDEANRLGLLFFSTPFDAHCAGLLVRLGIPALKVGSGDATHLPFLSELAGYGLPLIVSTGMCTLEEVEQAVDAVQKAGDPPLVLLHCLSAYPAPPEQVNLRAMDTLRLAHAGPVGFSDHTLGIDVAVAAVARGAAMIEKHLTLDKTRGGPDHAASLEPQELAALVRAARRVESALGDGRKALAPAEADVRRVARRSLVAARLLPAGTILGPQDLAAKRPGGGVSPAGLSLVLGRRLLVSLAPDQPLEMGQLE